MLVQFKNAAVVEAQSLPNRVTALDNGIERANPGLIPMHELTIDVNHQVFVLRIKFLQHLY
jgi:hypothetical protein